MRGVNRLAVAFCPITAISAILTEISLVTASWGRADPLTWVMAKKDARIEEIKAREAERAGQVKVSMVPAPGGSRVLVVEEPRASGTGVANVAPRPVLVHPDAAVPAVMAVLPDLFTAMVEHPRVALADALKQVGVATMTFFTALDASQDLRNWYMGVKRAQAIMDVEGIDALLDEMDTDVSDPLENNSVRNAKVSATRLRAEQIRWAAQRLATDMYSEKTKTETHTKVEIIVRREAKKAKKVVEE